MPLPPELKTARAGMPRTPHTTPAKASLPDAKDVAAAHGGSFLSKYFLVILFGFAVASMVVNSNVAHSVHQLEGSNGNNAMAKRLKDFRVSRSEKAFLKRMEMEEKFAEPTSPGSNVGGAGENQNDGEGGNEDNNASNDHENKENNDDDGQTSNPNKEEEQTSNPKKEEEQTSNPNKEEEQTANPNKEEEQTANPDKATKKPNVDADADAKETTDGYSEQHKIANLNCGAYGGPSDEDAEEMVYWEDIPTDALHMSPFHAEHPERKQQENQQPQHVSQFLTFEPDAGGWNNIRMAMETVLAMAFAMGRTLVLPPHQGMYLIDKGGEHQKNKFSFDHFFHMERISAEHIGLEIISTTEFLERCKKGEIVGDDGKPLTPPGGRTDWDGIPNSEQRPLRDWMREQSGENLLHFDPQKCIVAFPATDTEEDSNELELLPDKIAESDGGFPNYEKYIGKPNPVDAPALERLKEMSADRKALCLYTPELQKKRWLHFPVGMKTNYGDESRLLVHFYAFLFFQDWKQDLWMKRFVRDHVRYIDEIQCAAARVVTKLRERIAARTGQTDKHSTRFDTIHVRRGDFQFKDTRISAKKILIQLKRVLDQNTTLYIATDERDKAFFQPIVEYFADVAFLDDFVASELKQVNTNYFGMIDQLVASRGEVFFGCWFSTFTGYINRLRGYHADDHGMPGYEMGIVNSYYYAMPDRFDHMREFWPIKQQFYAREFPASWRLIDASVGTT
ncbi:unnamed protein product [Pseudo-nitzschia multistriata]|uniref:O-fucosyltransferase family protein n=1 Tax=Pseudo-nitzschia multistriata TaxID=183589 RepID=A0A448ZP84_9STRA|nr:unnamed protein product [Pseudo-nitzschia multistriata]